MRHTLLDRFFIRKIHEGIIVLVNDAAPGYIAKICSGEDKGIWYWDDVQLKNADNFADLMSPEEAARYSAYWDDVYRSNIELVSSENIYEYNMMQNPGPLAEIEGNPASNFYSGKYNMEVLTEDKIYYRVGQDGKPLGQWFTNEPIDSVVKGRIDCAVKPQWIDPVTGELTGTSVLDSNYAIKIPKGTTQYILDP